MPTGQPDANQQYRDTSLRMFEDLTTRLSEFTGAFMRTREDMAEMKATGKMTADVVKRIEHRQDQFEREMRERMETQHRRANERMVEIAREHSKSLEARLDEQDEAHVKVNTRVDGVIAEVKTIREERIAEKNQWRGPEKVMVVVQFCGIAAALAVAIGKIFGYW